MHPHLDLTSRIIAASFRVHNDLGPGHLEHVYQNALALVLRGEGLHVQVESVIDIHFEGSRVGICEADLIVEDLVVVETKVTESILPGHQFRLKAYLRSSPHETGLVVNFGPVRVEVRRVTITGKRRNSG
ncbi:MAG: GxxExxY protein [Planctomycetes bacterium]|nr:GxxExxY protein [Planctomycetota bacterium]